MARDDLHFRLRIPDELKSRVEETAKRNHRSMTAEIIARLEESFEKEADATAFREETNIPKPENTIYIVLDTNGMPISYHEAFTHLSELNRAAKAKFYSQQVRIIASEHLDSYDRYEDDLALILKYRKLRNKKLGKSAERFLEEFAVLKKQTHDTDPKKS